MMRGKKGWEKERKVTPFSLFFFFQNKKNPILAMSNYLRLRKRKEFNHIIKKEKKNN